MKLHFTILLFIVSFSVFAQDMQQGFSYLESGKYKEAKNFFDAILTSYPENRTAKLCYGRAIGLLGASEKALGIFSQLLNKYPDDFEIKLNYAEALLWDKRFEQAAPYYEQLIKENPKSFAAVLGYANTLSNLKQYPKALEWVNKALTITPDNPNALLSRKYIRLGYAFQYFQSQSYDEAIILLDQNLKDFPGDKETLLNKANVLMAKKDYHEAKYSYQQIATNPKDSIVALNGLALVYHLQHKEKKALGIASSAIEKVKLLDDKELYLATHERYIQALLWNRKFKKANIAIADLNQMYPDHEKLLALKATYGMYLNTPDQSIDNYERILSKDSTSYDGNLGIANAYKANNDPKNAYQYAYKTLSIFPKQPDAEKLIQNLNTQYTPFVKNKTAYTFDNGNNEAINSNIQIEFPLSIRLKALGSYDYRTTENTLSGVNAIAHNATLGLHYNPFKNIKLEGNLGINSSDAISTTYTEVVGSAKISLVPFKSQNIALGYQRALQNFNADLIDREIIMNDYSLTYNLWTTINIGWYAQAMYTAQSDENTRGLLYTSLYYGLLQRPFLKAGVNYQYLSFKDQLPNFYFSPSTFHQYELFMEATKSAEEKWFYKAGAAIGKQLVENNPATTTYRVEGMLGHQFSNRFKATVYGKYTNIASATAAGFEFTELGFTLKWYFLKQPVFLNRFKKNNEIKD